MHNFKGVSKKGGIDKYVYQQREGVHTPSRKEKHVTESHVTAFTKLFRLVRTNYSHLGTSGKRFPKAARLSAEVGRQGVGMRTAESISFSALFAFIAL